MRKIGEECGVFGVNRVDKAAEAVCLGLYSLQHRGQEAAGICAIDNGKARLHKDLGLVSDVFGTGVLDELPGRAALGHVRYSTQGRGRVVDAQPIVARYAEGDLAIAHNGNLTNAEALKKELVGKGAIFQSSSDSEVIVHLIARSRKPTVPEQIMDALGRIEGAYSLIIAVGSEMYAVRDPRGFRPLVLGETASGGWVVASESCALDIVGARLERDVEAGELVWLTDGEARTIGFLPQLPKANCVFELVYFARPDSRIWGIGVDQARRACGRRLAVEHPVEADCVVAVPDSANAAALGYAEESGIPFELGLLRNHYVGRTFIRPSQADRDYAARIKYNPVRTVLEGKRVVVVDDSIVRGTTSRSLVRFIRNAGGSEVHFRIASPPVRFPCHYGIDTPSRGELIGAKHEVSEVRVELGADSLGHISLSGMIDALGAEDGAFCDACFSGEYPAPTPGTLDDRSCAPASDAKPRAPVQAGLAGV